MKTINDWTIARYKSAMNRNKPSTAIKSALENNILNKDKSILDYGCGKGYDVQYLNSLDFKCIGYDPFYYPIKPEYADIVMLNYVLSVIEDKKERVLVLQNAYNLTKEILIIGVLYTKPRKVDETFNDGFKTQWNTFYKYYSPQELILFIETVLNKTPKFLSPGVYYVRKS